MRDEAATPILYFREDFARHHAGRGAAQDDIFSHNTLYVLEDALLDLKLLKDTFLGKEKNTQMQGKCTNALQPNIFCNGVSKHCLKPNTHFSNIPSHMETALSNICECYSFYVLAEHQ